MRDCPVILVGSTYEMSSEILLASRSMLCNGSEFMVSSGFMEVWVRCIWQVERTELIILKSVAYFSAPCNLNIASCLRRSTGGCSLSSIGVMSLCHFADVILVGM